MTKHAFMAAILALGLGATLPAAADEEPPAGDPGTEPAPEEAEDEEEEEESDDSPEAKARRMEAERRAVEQALEASLELEYEDYLNSPYNTYGRSFAVYMYDSAKDLRNAGIGLAIAAPVLAGGGFGVYFGLAGSSFEGRVSGGAVLWAASAACLGVGSALWLIWADDVDRLEPLVRGKGVTRAGLRLRLAPYTDREGRRGLVLGLRY